jgi:predicted PhzF superfamily epimerase YddE/YHI9
MQLPFYQVDAFADAVFTGNPAGVCPLAEWLPDATMQAIAAENNLSETAFFVPGGDDADFSLRWFTPTVEVDLCGHATLASAFVIMTLLEPGRTGVRFATRASGVLGVRRDTEWWVMDFPRWPAAAMAMPPAGLSEALGRRPPQVYDGPDWMAVYDEESEVRALKPDFAALARLPKRGIIATAPGPGSGTGPAAGPGTGANSGPDFISRFFAPGAGIDEDPVTGSAHCMLAPYWAERLGRPELLAHQISARGGEVRCAVRGERVELAGRAALYLEGRLHV